MDFIVTQRHIDVQWNYYERLYHYHVDIDNTCEDYIHFDYGYSLSDVYYQAGDPELEISIEDFPIICLHPECSSFESQCISQLSS